KLAAATSNRDSHSPFSFQLTGLTRWRGLGRPGAFWAPPQGLLFWLLRRLRRRRSQKRFLEGCKRSKPARNGRPRKSCQLTHLWALHPNAPVVGAVFGRQLGANRPHDRLLSTLLH